MADVVTCPGCGSKYMAGTTACADCGAPLLAGPALEPGDDDVGYDLADWMPEDRGQLAAALAAEAIASRWEDAELVVREVEADRVEELIDEIDHPDALAEDDTDDDGGAEILSALYVASDVLQHDPGSAVAIIELLEASERASELGPPYGLDGDLWREVQRRADTPADLLGEEADDEQVRAAAKTLRDAVHPLV